MNHLDLFSGYGGFSLALSRHGFVTKACADIDKFSSALMAERFPGIPNLGDVSAPDFAERAAQHGPFDIVTFGSPCQGFSVAGKRLGLDDPRSNLALVALRVARQLRPRWMVFENVPGLLSSDGTRDFGAFLGTVEECGYLGAWRIFDAQYAGVPQRRRRIFFVGYLGDWRPAAAVLFERESLSGDSAPSREAGQGFAADVVPSLTGSGRGVERTGESRGQDHPVIAHALTTHMVKGGDPSTDNYVTHSLRADGFDASEDGTGCGTLITAFDWRASQSNSLTPQKFVSSLRNDHHAIAFSAKDRGADAGDTSPTLRAGGHTTSHANGGVMPAVAAVSGVRRLTPLECERLMGLPDNWTAITYRNKPAADGPRYKAIGNGVAIPVVEWIAQRIATVSAILDEQRAAA